jgi:hypothetical protein
MVVWALSGRSGSAAGAVGPTPVPGLSAHGRRVYLNVHVSAHVADDGLLADLVVGTSLASLRHQLQGGGDAVAVADGLTAEVRHRMWSPRPDSDDGLGLIDAADPADVGAGAALWWTLTLTRPGGQRAETRPE